MHLKRWAALLLAAASWASSPAWAITSRYGATATLMPDGNILVVGGTTSDSGGELATVELVLEHGGGTVAKRSLGTRPAVVATIPRSSHTATLLPNGEVLVVGGISGGLARATAEVYNPIDNCWRPTMNLVNTKGRYNHTATLLNSGQVLICGGQQNAVSAPTDNMSQTCELYTPAMPAPSGCAADGSGFTGPITMLAPRAMHTATLLGDGRVFITGGLDTTGFSLNPYLVTSEIYTPGASTNFAAHNLIQARAYHRASLMGNGKVLIAGGHANINKLQNRGFLDSAEIYDPVANIMAPAGQIPMRVQEQAQVVEGDGGVTFLGGLGNITTTYFNATQPLPDNSSFITGDGSNITGGSIRIRANTTLSVPVAGHIQDGFIVFSFNLPPDTYSLMFDGGYIALPPGVEASPMLGTWMDLQGAYASCDEVTCGLLDVTRNMTLAASGSGSFGTYAVDDANITGKINSMTSSPISWTTTGSGVDPEGNNLGAPNYSLSSDDTWGTGAGTLVAGSQFNGTAVIEDLPDRVACAAGCQVLSASLQVTGGKVVLRRTLAGVGTADVATISLTGGTGALTTPANITRYVKPDGSVAGRFTAPLAITAVEADITVSTDYPAVKSPLNVQNRMLDSLTGILTYTVSRVGFTDADTFNVDVATVVIRKMIFGNQVKYDPTANTWGFSGSQSRGPSRFGAAPILTPSADIRAFGGRRCLDAGQTCASLQNVSNTSVIQVLPNFESVSAFMQHKRANHTSTLLPNGKILLAGGSNGPNVLHTAELFDPDKQEIIQTGSMNEVRDLHTATLLPNGRVLVTGGFTTNALSTGTSRTAEIYLPNAGAWVYTAPMPFPADNHTATLLPDGNVLVAGGFSNGIYLSSAAVYITTAAYWQSLPNMPSKRALHTATLLQDGRVLLAGGINQTGVLCSTVLYDPNWSGANAPWFQDTQIQDASALCAPVHSHSATQLKDGKVLVAGGNNGFGEVDFAFLYTPSVSGTAGTWTRTDAAGGNLINTKRFGHTATLLPSGSVMIAGGAQALGNSLKEVETFNVTGSSWQYTGDLTLKRANPAMTVGADGYVYVFGGNNGVTIEDSIDRVYFTDGPDVLSLGVPPGTRTSSITAVDMQPYVPGKHLTLTGRKLLGVGEASGGGGGTGNSSFHNPRLLLQSFAGSGGTGSQNGGTFTLDVTTRIYSRATDPNLWTNANSSITVQLPGNSAVPYPGLGGLVLPYGWYHLRSYSNAVYSEGKLIQVGPSLPAGAPSVPSGQVLGRSSITWSWNSGSLSLAPGAFDGYEVFSSSTGVLLSTHPPTASASYTQTGLGPASPASIYVAAYTASGPGTLIQSGTYYTNPVIPANISFSSVGYNSLTINWDHNGNVDGTVYEVYQSTDINFSLNVTTPVPKVLANTGTSADIQFLATNTTYYYRMRSFNGGDVASDLTGHAIPNASVVVATRTRTPVLDIAGFALDPTTIQWNWIPPGDDPNSYNVYNATSGLLIANIPGTVKSFIDVSLATNTQRCIRVSAVTDAGEGPLAQSATVYTLAAVPGLVSPPYDENSISTSGFVARWTAAGNPLNTEYRVQVLDQNNVVVDTASTTGFSSGYNGFTTAGVMFSAKVAAVNGDGYLTNYRVLGSSSTRAARPIGLVLSSSTSNALNVTWDTVNNSSSVTYQLIYSTDNFITTLIAIPFSAKYHKNYATISGVITSSTYSVLVQGQNGTGVRTAFSNELRTSPDNGCSSVGLGPGYVCREVDPDADSSFAGHIGIAPNDRAFTLRIAPGTFPSPVFIVVSTLSVTNTTPCGNGTPIGFSINATPRLQPLKAIPFSFEYDPADIPAGSLSRATLQRADPSGVCAPLTTLVDKRQHLMVTNLNHFSDYQVGVVAATTSPEETRVFPNPFFPSRGHGFVTFQQMPAGASVKIFTMRGELVFEGNANNAGLMTWLGVNRFGRPAASGVYLAVIENDNEKKIVKVVVVR